MITKRAILVVEDDTAIRRGLADALRFHGYEALEAADGMAGLHHAAEAHFDLALLDLALPGASGFDVLAAIQKRRPGLPVVILSARGEEADRVRGLRLGADDYVVKPFSILELLARLEAVLRRSPERQAPQEVITFAGGTARLGELKILHTDGAATDLTAREADLLRYLAEHRGRPVTREELLRRLWGLDARRAETRAVDMQVANLRHKLRDNAEAPKIILTARGKGYALA